MRHPSQALAWSVFTLSWPFLLGQIAAVLTIVYLIGLTLDRASEWVELVYASEFVIIASLVFLYGFILSKSQSGTRNISPAGFPYRTEYALPVSTATLLFIPLAAICVLVQAAVLIPGMLLNSLLLHTDVALLPISFAVFQFTVILVLLTWWTNNGLANTLGWIVAAVLYARGLLLPEFSRVEDSWVLVTQSPAEYLLPLMFTIVLGALAYLGVKKQRSGEPLFKAASDTAANESSQLLRDWLPLPQQTCPRSSVAKAELWKQRQLQGEFSGIGGGLLAAFAVFAILSIISFFVPGNDIPELNNVWFLTIAMYLGVCEFLMLGLYGVHHRNGVARVSLHDRAAAIGTAQLFTLQAAVRLGSVLIAGVTLAATFWLLGPFFIDALDGSRAGLLEPLAFIWQPSLGAAVLNILMPLLGFLSALLVVTTVFTWFMLESKKFSLGLALLPAYGFLLVLGLRLFFGDTENADSLNAAVFRNHLWLVVVLLPSAAFFMLRALLRDRVLTAGNALGLLGITAGIEAVYLFWLFAVANFEALNSELSMAVLGYLVVQGLLPAFALVFGLWTSSRIRHAS